ncbi:DUF7527 domain-containing protein [Natronobacterium texcoconense]|uniref:DUF7527 domain-containing protein n=1 Tax=Natronobacterium texcoconense TaxID=1095778 RepID=A0A1H1A610_NATTX|nr:transcriptional regulator [Natronobacterium texcoconense]SDQ35084.1 hypothetical protein SAMN04489842_0577 [Natronobacterium texcoconense]
MDPRTQERVEQWDSRPFSGGYDGLSDLADDGFSGAVTANGTCLFLLNGRIIGAIDGEIEDFQSASGTLYQAPHPSVPLLCSMEEHDGETRAKYYTNETSIEEVDRTLKQGSFTGYVELSENVLSGDYYLVYYGGRRMAAAYIGNSKRLITGDEAYERAVDEVGIYTVTNVDLEVVDVPGEGADPPVSSDDSSTGPTGTTASASPDDAPESNVASGTELDDSSIDPINVSEAGPGSVGEETEFESFDEHSVGETEADSVEATDGSAVTPDVEDEGSAPATDTGSPGMDDGPTTTATDVDLEDDDSSSEPASAGSDAASTPESGTGIDASSPEQQSTSLSSGPDPAEVEAAAEQLDESDITWSTEDDEPDEPVDERFEEEEQWRETRSIPSIDPEKTSSSNSNAKSESSSRQTRSSTTDRTSGDAGASSGTGSRTPDRQTSQPETGARDTTSNTTQTSSSSANAGQSGSSSQTQAQTQQLAERVERLEEKRDALETKANELASERDQLREENHELSSKIDRLQSRIEELESERQGGGERQESAVEPSGTPMQPTQALSGTNLFVRYESKSKPTLETAHAGDAGRSDVATNLQLEHHTEFDANEVAVDGKPYETFLTSTMAYQFVEWLTERALYEVRDTGNANGLADLYDAIPRIDRAELDATISLADDDTEDVPESVTFDVVAFDKRGNPLVLATLNDSRDPITEEELTDLEEKTSAVKANYPDLGAAFAVTSSYFEPGALEVTEKATNSGFLNRGSKMSYVNLSRKEGYHLCLVESRSEGFHMNVPEL